MRACLGHRAPAAPLLEQANEGTVIIRAQLLLYYDQAAADASRSKYGAP